VVSDAQQPPGISITWSDMGISKPQRPRQSSHGLRNVRVTLGIRFCIAHGLAHYAVFLLQQWDLQKRSV